MSAASAAHLLGPQFTWTFYAHAGMCLCGVAPLFAPEKVLPLLGSSCDEKCDADQCAGIAGPILHTALQLYAALFVVQAKMLRHAASTPTDLKFHNVLSQGQAVACAFSVGAVIQAEGSGYFSRYSLAPLTGLFTLFAARYGGGMNRMRWAANAAPKDPKEAEIESEFVRDILTELFMLFPVPMLTRVFQAHAALAFVSGATAFASPDMWGLMLTQETVDKCPWALLRLIIQLYGALIIGQFWIAWKATRLVNASTRRRLTESWAAMFTASFVILVGAWRNGTVSWLCLPSAALFAGMATMYWVCYVEPDVVRVPSGTQTAAGKAAGGKASQNGKNS